MGKGNRLVFGIGVNDADYIIFPTVAGKRVLDKYYRKWQDMLMRCYSSKFHKTNLTYTGVTVCDDWKHFSNFKQWVDEQDVKNWEKLDLDKDFLALGNKVYSPSTCVFIPSNINNFIVDRVRSRGSLPLGVCRDGEKYRARVNNPFTHKEVYIGHYDTPELAHQAWRCKKHKYACKLAETVSDKRVANRLRTMYSKKL